MAITYAEAAAAAARGIEAHGLDRDPRIAEAMRSGTPQPPLLVKRLDVESSDYYLVPWATTLGIVLIVEIAASNGALRGATPVPTPMLRLVLDLDAATQAATAAFPGSRIGVPELVWQPCRESMSPLQPLYRVPVNGDVVYISMDGTVFHALTLAGRGGANASPEQGS